MSGNSATYKFDDTHFVKNKIWIKFGANITPKSIKIQNIFLFFDEIESTRKVTSLPAAIFSFFCSAIMSAIPVGWTIVLSMALICFTKRQKTQKSDEFDVNSSKIEKFAIPDWFQVDSFKKTLVGRRGPTVQRRLRLDPGRIHYVWNLVTQNFAIEQKNLANLKQILWILHRFWQIFLQLQCPNSRVWNTCQESWRRRCSHPLLRYFQCGAA